MPSVSIHIDAPAERAWQLLSDVTRIGEWTHGAGPSPVVGDHIQWAVGRSVRALELEVDEHDGVATRRQRGQPLAVGGLGGVGNEILDE